NHLLFVRATEEIKKTEAVSLKRVVVPLDGSGLAEMVIPHALELARKMDLEIVLLRAYALPTPVYSAEDYAPDLGELWEQIKKEAQEYLAGKVDHLHKEGLRKVSTVLLEGYAADKIIDLGRERAGSLVAMCTHGRTGVGRWVMGSVTDRVVRHSGDPILVIRATSAMG
ncbi:MAG: universal stress protein, partial [Deltaproteobacteria bacterium]|nr:universal stress protein [Deltaproteobacteria bacterium]